MASKQNNTECMITSWGVAAFAGVIAMIMLYWMADFGALQAIFTGGLIGTVLGLFLSLTICKSQTAAADLAAEDKPATRYATEAAARNAERAAAANAVNTPVAQDGSAGVSAGAAGIGAGTAGTDAGTAGTKPGTAGETSGVSATATTRAKSVGGPEAGTIPADASDTTAPAGNWTGVHSTTAEQAPSGLMSTPAKAKAAPQAKVAPKAKAAPKEKASGKAAAADAKPAMMLSAARDGGADDLKLISGVGPKLEQTLNDLGIYHFDQVAKFKKKDIAWVDERLRFKGRIERDDWMSQAKILAKGGETEFSRKKKT
ncbi:hypothetical protein [uncultured Sulfitobacter sp.]|uniref:hypothetical protein n=1 Tax=uncultured Sulfitobacter sp. TaxID=191468 RepID=UPI0026390CD9|nr:hypothetical protein [uncultured Sulfitobacter sp.]